MSSYQELLCQREKLDKQIEAAKAREFTVILSEIKKKMLDYGITPADLGVNRTKSIKSRAQVAPKYRDPITGAAWSGRGKKPRWMGDKNQADYLIQK